MTDEEIRQRMETFKDAPIGFYMDGPSLRLKVLEMAFKSQSGSFSIDRLVLDASSLIKWINMGGTEIHLQK